MNNRLDHLKPTPLSASDTPEKKQKRGQERFSSFELENIRRNFAKRLKIAFRHESNAFIARALKTTDPTIKLYTDGKTLPTFDMLLQIHYATRVNLHWLITGEGPMRIENKELFEAEEIERITKLSGDKTLDESIRAFTMAMVDAVEKVQQ